MSLRQRLPTRPDVSLPTQYVPRYLRDDYDPEFSLEDSATLFRWLDETNLVWTYDRERKRKRRFDSPDGYEYVEGYHAYRDIDRRYEPVTHKTHSSQQDCADAWAEMQFPVHNVGKQRSPTDTRPWPPGDHGFSTKLYSSPNFTGIQHADGSGRLRHYRVTEAWRTRSGLIINNVECWSRGFARCTTPGGWHNDDISPDHRLSLSAVEDMTDMIHARSRGRPAVSDGGQPMPPNDDEYDLMSVEQVPDGHTKLDDSVTNLRVFQFYSGAAVVCLTDRTAHGAGGDRVAFALAPDEARPYRIGKHHWAEVVEDHLTPEMVQDADLPVVGAHESDDDPRIPGDAIIRQGEWFFLPEGPDFEPARNLTTEAATQDANLGNHEPRECGITNDRLYVRGWLDHQNRDHERAYIGERWHRAVRHDRDDVEVWSNDESTSRRSSRRSTRRVD